MAQSFEASMVDDASTSLSPGASCLCEQCLVGNKVNDAGVQEDGLSEEPRKEGARSMLTKEVLCQLCFWAVRLGEGWKLSGPDAMLKSGFGGAKARMAMEGFDAKHRGQAL